MSGKYRIGYLDVIVEDFANLENIKNNMCVCVCVCWQEKQRCLYLYIHITKPSLWRECSQKNLWFYYLSLSLKIIKKGILLWPLKRVVTQRRLSTSSDDHSFSHAHGPHFFKVFIMTTSLSIVEEAHDAPLGSSTSITVSIE